MKDRTKIRAGKRIMAVMLSFAMVFGIFSGMKLDAEAREGKAYKYEELKKGTVLYAGDLIDISTQKNQGVVWGRLGILIYANGKNYFTVVRMKPITVNCPAM